MLTERQLQGIMPRATVHNVAAWVGPLREAMMAHGINTVQRMAGFLASVANETGQLTATTEASYFNTPLERIQKIFGIAAPTAAQLALWKSFGRQRFDVEFFNWVYDDANRGGLSLGNDKPGDGYKYRGLGPGQITGKRNFRAVFRRMGLPEDTDPMLLLDPVHGSMAFAGYWEAAGNNQRMDRGAFIDAMRIMNSGLKSFDEHQAHYDRALRVLKTEVKETPATPAQAAGQVVTGKIGAAGVAAGGLTTISVVDAVTKVGEVRTLADASKGFLGTFLPSPYTEIALGVAVLLLIGFVLWRYGFKLLRGEAVSS